MTSPVECDNSMQCEGGLIQTLKTMVKGSEMNQPPRLSAEVYPGYQYATQPNLDSVDGASLSSAGSMHSSRSASSFRSTGSQEARRRQKVRSRVSMAKTFSDKICAELECSSCGRAMSFQLKSSLTNTSCFSCGNPLGAYSVSHGFQGVLFIKAVCPFDQCGHHNYQTTTRLAAYKSVTFTCLCEDYSPRLTLSDWTPGPLRPKYHCTFCQNSYHSKYGWERHETSKHRPSEVWECCSGINFQESKICMFCPDKGVRPTTKHLKTHRYEHCAKRSVKLRTYYRKDQFYQHLRSYHRCYSGCVFLETLWRKDLDVADELWHCGFCSKVNMKWHERLKHIGKHWEQGLTMGDWVHHSIEESEWVDGVEGESFEEAGKAPESMLSVNSLWGSLKRVLPRL